MPEGSRICSDRKSSMKHIDEINNFDSQNSPLHSYNVLGIQNSILTFTAASFLLIQNLTKQAMK